MRAGGVLGALLLLAGGVGAELLLLTAPPTPFPAAYRLAGLAPADWDLANLREHLGALGPVGHTVLGCADSAARGRVLLATLARPAAPPELAAALEGRGLPPWSVMLAGEATARGVRVPGTSLLLVRLDLLLEERSQGGVVTLPGLVAHELTHLAQRCWGGLRDPPASGPPVAAFHDRMDEAEAHLVETLVNQRVLRRWRRQGRPLEAVERAELGIAFDPRGLAAMGRRVARNPSYRDLPAGPLHDPRRYRAVADPFRRLRAGPAPVRYTASP